MIVQALTDNRNRTSAEIKNIFSRNGGSFAEPGAVSWQFERKGIVQVDRAADEDELMLVAADAGAEDVQDLGDRWQVTTPPTELHAVRTAIEEAGIKVKSSDLTMIPTTSVALDAGGQGQVGAAPDGRARGARRRRGRVRQLRHPRRRARSCQRLNSSASTGRESRMVEVGQEAPDFTLPGVCDGETPRLHALGVPGPQGRARVLSGRQHAGLHAPDVLVPRRLLEVRRDRRGAPRDLAPRRRQPRGVGREAGFHFPLLADTDKKVIELYGVRGGKLIAVKRSVFVVGPDGIVRFVDRKVVGATFVSADKLVPVLAKL